MSTGMASLSEIDAAINTLRENGCDQICLLKCTSAYPSPPESMNLATIPHLSQAFDLPVGLSDHTLGIAVPVASAALGACVIEKHFTLDRNEGGPDSAFSLEPAEFKSMVDAVRVAEKAIGRVQYGGTKEDQGNRAFRRSLFIVQDVKAGDLLTSKNVRSIRPGYGLEPKHFDAVIGRTAKEDLSRGTPLKWQHVA
jgi:N-acetylneuraminate synthase